MPFVDAPEIVDALSALKVSVRCIPLEERRPAKCLFTGRDTDRWAIFAKAY